MMYTGAMEKGQMHGKGTLVYPNSERYEGDFRHGKRGISWGSYYYERWEKIDFGKRSFGTKRSYL